MISGGSYPHALALAMSMISIEHCTSTSALTLSLGTKYSTSVSRTHSSTAATYALPSLKEWYVRPFSCRCLMILVSIDVVELPKLPWHV